MSPKLIAADTKLPLRRTRALAQRLSPQGRGQDRSGGDRGCRGVRALRRFRCNVLHAPPAATFVETTRQDSRGMAASGWFHSFLKEKLPGLRGHGYGTGTPLYEFLKPFFDKDDVTAGPTAGPSSRKVAANAGQESGCTKNFSPNGIQHPSDTGPAAWVCVLRSATGPRWSCATCSKELHCTASEGWSLSVSSVLRSWPAPSCSPLRARALAPVQWHPAHPIVHLLPPQWVLRTIPRHPQWRSSPGVGADSTPGIVVMGWWGLQRPPSVSTAPRAPVCTPATLAILEAEPSSPCSDSSGTSMIRQTGVAIPLAPLLRLKFLGHQATSQTTSSLGF